MTSETRTEDRAQDAVRDERPVAMPDKPCCCPPRIALWGETSSTTVALTNQMQEDEQLRVRADANASVNPPGGPQVNADGSGGSELRTHLKKDVDLAAVTSCYTFHWRVTAACQPVSVAVTIDGDVNARFECAPDQGSTTLCARRVQDADQVRTGPRGSAWATVVVLDCHGHTARCRVELTEP